MFYKQFLKIIDILDEQFIDEFDFWLATISDREAKTISVSAIASRFEVKYSVADTIVKFAEEEGILKKRYVVLCGNEECEFFYREYNAAELTNVIGTKAHCHYCGNEFLITYENTVVVYCKEKEPNIPESLIQQEISKRIKKNNGNNINFTSADSLEKNPSEIFSLYYHPDESAYSELSRLKKNLDGIFATSKEKGDALEKFALYLFQQIRGISGTNKIKTYTNQFDCTMRFPQTSRIFPTIMNYMTPYFIVECKNEKDEKGKGKTPSNTYFHKLSDIMDTNDSQLGIIISRGKASEEDIRIAHDSYLVHRNSNRQRIMLSISDDDIEALVDRKINLLDYLSFKMDCLTMNAKNATFDMFEKHKN